LSSLSEGNGEIVVRLEEIKDPKMVKRYHRRIKSNLHRLEAKKDETYSSQVVYLENDNQLDTNEPTESGIARISYNLDNPISIEEFKSTRSPPNKGGFVPMSQVYRSTNPKVDWRPYL